MIVCPWCHNPFEPTSSGRCPHCGALPPKGESAEVQDPGAPGAAAEAGGGRGERRSLLDVLLGPEGTGLPWERRREYGFWRGLGLTVRMVLLSPIAAFRSMRRSGGLGGPLLYAAILCASALAAAALLREATAGITSCAARNPFFTLMPGSRALRLTVGLLSAPVLGLLLPAGAALGSHLCLRLFGPRTAALETTWRTICYAAGSTAPLLVVPVCGSAFFFLWYVIAATAGLLLVYRMQMMKALGAAALPPIVVLTAVGIVLATLALDWGAAA
ncbi:MAG: YIP1 family protein [Planctomycetota bacterium]|jgi:hypothetical protein